MRQSDQLNFLKTSELSVQIWPGIYSYPCSLTTFGRGSRLVAHFNFIVFEFSYFRECTRNYSVKSRVIVTVVIIRTHLYVRSDQLDYSMPYFGEFPLRIVSVSSEVLRSPETWIGQREFKMYTHRVHDLGTVLMTWGQHKPFWIVINNVFNIQWISQRIHWMGPKAPTSQMPRRATFCDSSTLQMRVS